MRGCQCKWKCRYLALKKNSSLKRLWVKKRGSKTLAEDAFWQKMKFWRLKTRISKTECEIFNFVDLCNYMGGRREPGYKSMKNNVIDVSFFVKCFNPLNFYFLTANILRNRFFHTVYFFTSILIKLLIFNGKLHCYNAVNSTFTNALFTSLLTKNIFKKTKLCRV